jgi:protein-S-isoprenylcysteine O-methyltransferase Ste14
MIESIIVTLFPVLFLILLFGGGRLFHDKGIDIGGTPPINRALFLISKYSIVLLWAAVVMQSLGVDLSMIRLPDSFRYAFWILWAAGFTLLFIGRVGMGNSFRIGEPAENTRLKINGLFRFSRNPMYVGVYMTIFATIIYTANLVNLLVGILIIIIHHLIVLAEEKYLKKQFGKRFTDYCAKVPRYV